MTVGVEVSNETQLRLAEGVLLRLAEGVLLAEGAEGQIAIAFVAEEAIAELNGRYRSLPESTDVLSFPSHVEGEEDDWPEPDDADHAYLGDIVISPDVAARHAEEDAVALSEELGRLVVHGVLHLLSYDHEVDGGEMMARQAELLVELAPLLPALLPGD